MFDLVNQILYIGPVIQADHELIVIGFPVYANFIG